MFLCLKYLVILPVNLLYFKLTMPSIEAHSSQHGQFLDVLEEQSASPPMMRRLDICLFIVY